MPRQAELSQLNVAAGILVDDAGRVLVAERLGGGPFNGMWEFPGGKIHSGESARDAVLRELDEEIGVECLSVSSFMYLEHEYSDRFVAIEFFVVREWRQVPTGREGQKLRWVSVARLNNVDLLPADAPVVSALQREFGQRARFDH